MHGRSIGQKPFQKPYGVIAFVVGIGLFALQRNLLATLPDTPSKLTHEASALAFTTAEEKRGTRIALMSGFVSQKDASPPVQMEENYFDYMINKACYSYIWGYDFIFNTTYGFDESYPKWHWLNFGTWNKVKHIRSRIEEYDYIFYTDTDFFIHDIMRPVESFVHEFELHGKTNVQLFLPQDWFFSDVFLFSAFAFLMRNSKFSLDILKYWDDFARGMCPRGNLNMTSSEEYTWYDADQPGFWYAIIRAYADHFPDRVPADNYPQCNTTTGTLRADDDGEGHPAPWDDYFRNMANLTKGSTGEGLKAVPNDQPYIFSDLPNGLRSGMGLDLNWVDSEDQKKVMNYSYAFHVKDASRMPPLVKEELQRCKTELGCFAHYDKNGEIRIGCGDRVYA